MRQNDLDFQLALNTGEDHLLLQLYWWFQEKSELKFLTRGFDDHDAETCALQPFYVPSIVFGKQVSEIKPTKDHSVSTSFIHVTLRGGGNLRGLSKVYTRMLCPKVNILSILHSLFPQKGLPFHVASSLKPLSHVYSRPITSPFVDKLAMNV